MRGLFLCLFCVFMLVLPRFSVLANTLANSWLTRLQTLGFGVFPGTAYRVLVLIESRDLAHLECTLHIFREDFLALFADVRVYVHGRFQLGVPQPFLDVFHVPALVVSGNDKMKKSGS